MNKKALEMSFAWIFSIIAGAAILAVAIYFASQYVQLGNHQVNTETAKQLSNILDPLQTSIETGKIDVIDLVSESQIYTTCNLNNNFGETRLQVAEKNGFSSNFSKPGGDIGSNAEYLFAENTIQGKEINFFITSFSMPFKTADIMMMYSDSYCFVSPPDNIRQELEGLGIGNNTKIFVTSSISECNGMKTVCFPGSGCEIQVFCSDLNCRNGYVKKQGNTEYFVDSLVYGAVFSSKDNYECNVKRVMNRLSSVAEIYRKKALFVSSRGCDSGLQPDMGELATIAGRYNSTNDLIQIQLKSEDILSKNQELACQLF